MNFLRKPRRNFLSQHLEGGCASMLAEPTSSRLMWRRNWSILSVEVSTEQKSSYTLNLSKICFLLTFDIALITIAVLLVVCDQDSNLNWIRLFLLLKIKIQSCRPVLVPTNWNKLKNWLRPKPPNPPISFEISGHRNNKRTKRVASCHQTFRTHCVGSTVPGTVLQKLL